MSTSEAMSEPPKSATSAFAAHGTRGCTVPPCASVCPHGSPFQDAAASAIHAPSRCFARRNTWYTPHHTGHNRATPGAG